ncbi:MAG: hypothetical protein ABIL58_18580 [Pseudomonadota bacterium]
MGDGATKAFATKHGADTTVNPEIRKAVIAKAKDGHLPCAAAFSIAHDLAVTPADVGRTVDLMEYRLTHCQLGLFGYQPHKKIVEPAASVSDDLAAAIRAALVSGRLPCREAWAISDALNIGKRVVSGACETLGIKIKPCQLGAF